jgi:hypothetical protein
VVPNFRRVQLLAKHLRLLGGTNWSEICLWWGGFFDAWRLKAGHQRWGGLRLGTGVGVDSLDLDRWGAAAPESVFAKLLPTVG